MLRGNLWKWTNYWNGWQLRWFTLDNGGTLSYFKSQEEENEGCKGSLNVSSCEIRVHPTDILRLDISISGEQHIYLRANTEKERQEWLVALGSVKACVQKSKTVRRASEGIMTKRSELKLYCDLLMQQVHTIKSSINKSQEIDIEKLSANSSLLVETCDIFIKTLDETMILTESPCNIITGISHHKDSSIQSPKRSQRNSVSGIDGGENRNLETASSSATSHSKPVSSGIKDEKAQLSLKNPFQEVELSLTYQVPTKAFLKSSESVIIICDFLNEIAFEPLKGDMLSHINTLWSSYKADSYHHKYIQNMVNQELKTVDSWENSPCGQSLHWLVRGLMFIHNFLRHLMESDDSVESSLEIAFEGTLEDYRGGRMKTVYKNALRKCPTREEFLVFLGLPKDSSSLESRKKLYQPELFLSLAKYLDSMEKCLMILVQFCDNHSKKANAVESTTSNF